MQAAHRRELEVKELESQIKHQIRKDREYQIGQIFAFLIAILGIGCGVYITLQGYQIAGSIISTLGLSGLITPFIIGRKIDK